MPPGAASDRMGRESRPSRTEMNASAILTHASLPAIGNGAERLPWSLATGYHLCRSPRLLRRVAAQTISRSWHEVVRSRHRVALYEKEGPVWLEAIKTLGLEPQ
jgi:hypothetical protein